MTSKINGSATVGSTVTIDTSTRVHSGTNVQTRTMAGQVTNNTSPVYHSDVSNANTYNLSFTTSPFSGNMNNKNFNLDATTYNLTNVTNFEQIIKSQPINIQLQTLSDNMKSISNSISGLQSYFDVNHITDMKNTLQTIQSKVIEILPYATDEQVDTIQLQQAQALAMKQEYGNNYYHVNPNNIPIQTSFATSVLHNGGTVDWGMLVESGGSLYAAGQKFDTYTSLLGDQEGLSMFGNELINNAGSYTELMGDTLGIDMSESVLSAFGIEETLGVVGIGALEVGTVAAGGLAALAVLGVLGASYGIYKALGGSENLPEILGDSAKFFENLFSP